MDFATSVRTCFTKYADFSGRARRSEYWWFYLMLVLINFVSRLFGDSVLGLVIAFAQLALIVPWLAVGARRLHDTGRSGWWQMLWLIPIVGWIILIVWLAGDTKPGANTHGADPKNEGSMMEGYGQTPPSGPAY